MTNGQCSSAGHTGPSGSSGSLGSEPIRLVSFDIDQEQFAVDILRVQEINRMMSLTKIPQSPQGVRGVINLRGRLVPVLDLRTRLGLDPIDPSDASRIIVVDILGSTIGFIVDAVHEVLEVDPATVEPTPAITTCADMSYIQGVAKIGEKLLILLDLDNLLTSETLQAIDAVGTSSQKAA